jgi:hypothetical protein
MTPNDFLHRFLVGFGQTIRQLLVPAEHQIFKDQRNYDPYNGTTDEKSCSRIVTNNDQNRH